MAEPRNMLAGLYHQSSGNTPLSIIVIDPERGNSRRIVWSRVEIVVDDEYRADIGLTVMRYEREWDVIHYKHRIEMGSIIFKRYAAFRPRGIPAAMGDRIGEGWLVAKVRYLQREASSS
jgi:hypothetical protein